MVARLVGWCRLLLYQMTFPGEEGSALPMPEIWGACDRDTVCHKALASHHQRSRPAHIFKNLESRLTPETSSALTGIRTRIVKDMRVARSLCEDITSTDEKKINAIYGDKLMDLYMSELMKPTAFRTHAECSMHPKVKGGCPLPHTEWDQCPPAKRRRLRMASAGTTCTDVSTIGMMLSC